MISPKSASIQLHSPKNDDISSVIITIESNYFQEVCHFLLSQHIGFNMSFNEPYNLTNFNRDTIEKTTSPLVNQTAEVNAICAFFDKYAKEEPHLPIPSVKEMANQLELSELYVTTVFKNIYGKSFLQAVLEERYSYAAQLLVGGHKAVQVAQMIGYGAKSSIKFNKMFQKYYGITPKKYQMKHKL